MADKFATLRKRIAEDSDLLLFDEAIKCAKARAYRAAYIITWVSIAESLRSKFVTMAVRDDAVQRIVKKIQEFDEQERPVDKFLIETAANLGIIAADEKQKLEHILHMRGFYAHPTGAGPTREELLASIQVGIDAVLSKPPLLRYSYVGGLLRALFTDRHYLDDVPDRVREFATGVAPRIHPDVVPNLLRGLIEQLEPIMNDPGAGIFSRRGIIFGTAILATLRPNLATTEWDVLSLVAKYPHAGSMLLGTPEVWGSLPDQCRDMVVGHMVEPVEDGKVQPPSSTTLERARALSSQGLLTPRQNERVQMAVATAPESIMKAARVPLKEYVQRILDGLSSHNWYKQNPTADAFYIAGAEECGGLDDATQEQLGRNILQAAEGTAVSAEFMMENLVKTDEVWPRQFVEGLLLETMVNEAQNFRLKDRHLANAVRIVAKHPDHDGIFQEATEKVRNSRARFDNKEYDKGIAAIETIQVRVDGSVHHYLEDLIDAMQYARGQSEANEDVPF